MRIWMLLNLLVAITALIALIVASVASVLTRGPGWVHQQFNRTAFIVDFDFIRATAWFVPLLLGTIILVAEIVILVRAQPPSRPGLRRVEGVALAGTITFCVGLVVHDSRNWGDIALVVVFAPTVASALWLLLKGRRLPRATVGGSVLVAAVLLALPLGAGGFVPASSAPNQVDFALGDPSGWVRSGFWTVGLADLQSPAFLAGIKCPAGGPCYFDGDAPVSAHVNDLVVGSADQTGVTWTNTVIPNVVAGGYPMACSDAMHCVASASATGPALVASTADGWRTSTVHPFSHGVYGAPLVACSIAGDCLAVVDGPCSSCRNSAETEGAVMTSHDRGLTWTDDPTVVLLGLPRAFDCTAAGGSCWLVGSQAVPGNENESSGFVEMTRDNGVHWMAVPLPGTIPPLLLVSCGATNSCMAFGYTAKGPGMLITVTDQVDGSIPATWATNPLPDPTANIFTLDCVDSTSCFAAGLNEPNRGVALFRTNDGGTTWSTTSLPWISAVQSMGCITPERCLAIATVGTFRNASPELLATTDGWHTWRTLGFPPVNTRPKG
jgi:hypothetical protein